MWPTVAKYLSALVMLFMLGGFGLGAQAKECKSLPDWLQGMTVKNGEMKWEELTGVVKQHILDGYNTIPPLTMYTADQVFLITKASAASSLVVLITAGCVTEVGEVYTAVIDGWKGQVLGAQPIAHETGHCITSAEYHANFQNETGAMFKRQVLEGEAVAVFLGNMNSEPPITNWVADFIYFYTEEGHPLFAVAMFVGDCLVLSGTMGKGNVLRWMGADKTNGKPKHLPFNPNSPLRIEIDEVDPYRQRVYPKA